jgi:hypothetical protein
MIASAWPWWSFTVNAVHAHVSVSIRIYSGWNLIGVPGELDDPSVDGVFGANVSHVKSLYTYSEGVWGYWIPGIPSPLTSFEAGKGYWVLTDASFSIQISGYCVEGPGLVPEWNLIGITKGTEQSVEDYLGGVAWSSIYGFNSSTQDWSYNIRGIGGSLTILRSGEGYWVYINE